MEIDPSIIVALISLLGTIIVAVLNSGKMNKADAVELEHRLTVMEKDLHHVQANMFSQEDRVCLTLVNERVENLMATIVKMGAQNLKNPGRLDVILDTIEDKAGTVGWPAVVDYVKTDLTEADRSELLVYLEAQSKVCSKWRQMWAGLYLGMLRKELTLDDSAMCAEV